MKTEDIISTLVKCRERCRQLMRLFRRIITELEQTGADQPDPELMKKADFILTQLLLQVRDLPPKPSHTIADHDRSREAERLLSEIGELMESTLVIEREVRGRQSGSVPAAALGLTRSLP